MTVLMVVMNPTSIEELIAAPPPCVYLESVDLDAPDGMGGIVLTRDKAKALRFTDIGEAMECWRAQSRTYPIRHTDGKPNRPLTAFTITFEKIEDGTAP